MTPSTRRTVRKWASLAAAAGLALSVIVSPSHPADAAAPGPAAALTLVGEGSYDVYQEFPTWLRDLLKTGMNFNYTEDSGNLGRQDLTAGGIDFAISGVPFSSNELAKLPGGASDLISAPVFASGLGALFSRVSGSFQIVHWSCDPTDPNCLSDPNTTVTPTNYTGPLNIPAANLAAMMLDPRLSLAITPTYHGTPYCCLADFNNPDIINASGIKLTTDDQFQGPTYTGTIFSAPQTYLQSGAAEEDYYAQLFAATAAPSVWSNIQQVVGISVPTINDHLPPQLAEYTLQGAAQTVDGIERSTGILLGPTTVALGPPSSLHQFNTDPAANKQAKDETAQFLGVQNGSGQYETPTPTSIDAAIDAGGAAPLYALTSPVSGAYPLTYVDQLYAPAHGLTPVKTEGLATLIRYLATAGQEYTAAVGDGRLSPALTQQAEAAANQLVLSNCTGPKAAVAINSDPGPDMPVLPTGSAGAKDIAAIGPMLHCTANTPVPATTTTTAPKSTTTVSTAATTTTPASGISSPTTVSGSSSGVTGGGSSGTGSGSASNQSTGTNATGGAGTTGGNSTGSGSSGSNGASRGGAISFLSLPLPLPWSGPPGLDRLAGLVVGALLILLLRRPVRWVLGVLRS